MLRKVFSVLCILTFLIALGNNTAFAERLGSKNKVAVLLDAPTGMFSEPEKVYKNFQKTLEDILKGSSHFDIIPITETDAYLQIYREENDLISEMSSEGFYNEKPLKKDDINNICQYFNSDYLIYARVSSTVPTVSSGFFSASQNVNVTLDFRVWSNNKQDFSYMKRTTNKGTSTAIYAGIGSASKALEDGLKKGLKEVNKDNKKVREALMGVESTHTPSINSDTSQE